MLLFSVISIPFLILSAPASAPQPGTAEYYASLPESVYCMEFESGVVLAESNADLQRPPASMIKMILMLMVDEGVQAGKWNYDQNISVSKNSESMGGTQVYLKTGDTYSLDQLMNAVAVFSANDAAMAVAEGLWGGKEVYLQAANRRIRELGMVNSTFNSVHGLPPSKGQSFDLTTARDMACLGRECVRHPKILEWTSKTELIFRESDGPKQNTNKLLSSIPGCDGLKTGFIHAAGFCITATAARGGIRLITVVMGDTKYGRFERAREVMEEAFTKVKRVKPVTAGTVVGRPVAVENGLQPSVVMQAKGELMAVVKNEDAASLQLEVTAPSSVKAPVAAGSKLGKVRLVLGSHVYSETELLAASSVSSKSVWRKVGEWTGLK